jgi:hypothetical protein
MIVRGWQAQGCFPVILLGIGFVSLDPHNALHLFVVPPLIAAVIVAGAAMIVQVVLGKWLGWIQSGVELADGDGIQGMRVRYGIAGLLVWVVLSSFLALDLAGSVSLYPLFLGVYAGGTVMVVLVLLYPRPTREKALIVFLVLVIFVSVRAVDWNSRKPFLRDLERVKVGMTEAQACQIMESYRNKTGSLIQADEQGRMISGTLSYRHTSESWGNSDIGVLVFEHGRVVNVRFLPD